MMRIMRGYAGLKIGTAPAHFPIAKTCGFEQSLIRKTAFFILGRIFIRFLPHILRILAIKAWLFLCHKELSRAIITNREAFFNQTMDDAAAKLQKYRLEIDALDHQLMDILARRFDVIRAVGRLKTENNIAIVQSERAKLVIERAAQMAAEKNIDPDFIRKFYTDMVDLAHVMEYDIKDRHERG